MRLCRVILAVVGAAIMLAAMLAPAMRKSRIRGGPSCSFNLKLIQQAKAIYAEDFHLTNDVRFTKEQLLPYGLGSRWPGCPKGGEYSIGTLGESPRCSYPDHAQLTAPTQWVRQ